MKRGETAAASQSSGVWLAAFVVTSSWLGCASVERGRYGVTSLDIQGTEQVDEAALEACLVTLERPYVELRLGVSGADRKSVV